MKLNFITFAVVVCLLSITFGCENNCYSPGHDDNCRKDEVGQDSYTMHMSVHPHLDAYWIFNFDSYYDPKPNQGDVMSYFRSNRFNSVKEIFNTIVKVLSESKQHRETFGRGSQKAHRSFMNSQMGFFKKWYNQQHPLNKQKVKDLLKTKYWEILGGGFVEHDQGCAYYDDIIENFQTGLTFLKNEFNYTPKAAISADSFGHSQTTLAILAHLGIEGFFVERSDEHILLQNKTQFIWKAKSANGQYYGALPTHIRWAIHGFQDQFIGFGQSQNLCATKENYINNMRRENEFLKRILHSPHIMRYFGHDFQQFDEYSYKVIEAIMEKFSSERCNKVVAVYGNPTEYFLTLMGEVFGEKKKPIAVREQDIMPIWDYDSGLYWTGYYTTDAYHKKDYRDTGRFLYGVRKFMLPSYSPEKLKDQYENLEQLAEQVSYLQHHDGISGTSKYTVMDELEIKNQQLIEKIKETTLKRLFETEFDSIEGQKNEFCIFGTDCKITSSEYPEINLKIFNSAGYKRSNEPFVVQLPYETYYTPNCPYELNCLCQEIPCECSLFMYPQNYGSYVSIKLKKENNIGEFSKFVQLKENANDKMFSFNSTHFTIQLKDSKYSIGYKKIVAEGTNRQYAHLSRYGDQFQRGFHIRSGKYALGNDPNKILDLTQINKVLKLESKRNIIILVKWNRQGMKTVIKINKEQMNEWKVQTHAATQAYNLQDLYLQVATGIKNEKKFYTDSNGWLVMKRQLFHHDDYQAHFDRNKYDDIDGNSYPMTAFAYIQDQKDKVSINTDRPQGVIAYRPGTLWVNFDRLSSDDGKWVYENTFRSDYQRFSHVITVQNVNNNQRKIQTLYDMPIMTQISYSKGSNEALQQDHSAMLNEWTQYSGLNGLKTLIKPINDTTVVVRIHNLDDSQLKKVKIFVGEVSPLLTAFYGNLVHIQNVEQRSLGNNMHYQQFVDTKWNWNNVVDLKNENSIFNKEFGETVTLRPLEIRTFLFYGVKFVQGCFSPSKLVESGNKASYTLNLQKPSPKREEPKWQKQAIDYMLNQNHCNVRSPISIDKKYPNEQSYSESFAAESHKLKHISPNHYHEIVKNTPPIQIEDMKQSKPREQQQKQSQKPQQPQQEHGNLVKRQQQTKTPQQTKTKKEQSTIDTNKKPTKEDIDNQAKSSQNLSQQDKNKLRYIQIRRKIQNMQLLTKEQKQIYFTIRLRQIEQLLQDQSTTKP